MRMVELHSLAAKGLVWIQSANGMAELALLDDLLGLALSLWEWVSKGVGRDGWV